MSEERLPYDYSELRGLVRQHCGTLGAYSRAIGISLVSLNDRLQGKLPFKQDEMAKTKKLMGLSAEELERVFFTKQIQKTV